MKKISKEKVDKVIESAPPEAIDDLIAGLTLNVLIDIQHALVDLGEKLEPSKKIIL